MTQKSKCHRLESNQRHTDTNSVKNPAFYKGFFGSVRSNRTAYRFRSLHFLVIRFRALVSEGSKQSVHSFSFTSLRFIRSHTVCIELASSHGGLCSSSQASNESTVRRKRYGTASRTLRFLHLPVSASGPLLYGLWQRKPPGAYIQEYQILWLRSEYKKSAT